KLSVSALMFDFILTGPTSGVSAGQYIMGLVLDSLALVNPEFKLSDELKVVVRRWGAVVIACAITLYFFPLNLLWIHESRNKAIRLMAITTIMGVVMLVWCGITLAVRGPVNYPPLAPDLSPKFEYEVERGPDRATGEVREMWKRDASGKLVPKMEPD